MIAENQEMTKEEIAEQLGIKGHTLQRALDQLQIEGKRDLSDRRRVVYPPDTLERVRQWLTRNP